MIFDVAHKTRDVLRVIRKFGNELVDRLLLHELHGFNAGVLLFLIDRFDDLSFYQLIDPHLDLRRSLDLLPFHFRLAALTEQLFLNGNELLNPALSDVERFDHVSFGYLERSALDHHDRVL